ncbi:hypothetical protein [Desulfuromonas thiophila]|uniref:Uncharacterized protein n=1 Tax=Desulfuromonas thiophila TaxID=57664 RepID=A0A1G7BBY6_9BACT|nr:hypothetical protein [Desulfuromonas thiophila]SDE23745.1 hypothetical protein SAMN05661003_105129 [Desulfuromonas thiophila]
MLGSLGPLLCCALAVALLIGFLLLLDRRGRRQGCAELKAGVCVMTTEVDASCGIPPKPPATDRMQVDAELCRRFDGLCAAIAEKPEALARLEALLDAAQELLGLVLHEANEARQRMARLELQHSLAAFNLAVGGPLSAWQLPQALWPQGEQSSDQTCDWAVELLFALYRQRS